MDAYKISAEYFSKWLAEEIKRGTPKVWLYIDGLIKEL